MLYDPETDPTPTAEEITYALLIPDFISTILDRHQQSRQLVLKMAETTEDLRRCEEQLTAQLYEVLRATIEARTLAEVEGTLLTLVQQKAEAQAERHERREAEALQDLLPTLEEVEQLLVITPEGHPARGQVLAARQLLIEMPRMAAECADEVDFELWFTERARALGITARVVLEEDDDDVQA